MFLVGDNKNFCTALITLDVGVILRDKLGIEVNDMQSLQNKLKCFKKMVSV